AVDEWCSPQADDDGGVPGGRSAPGAPSRARWPHGPNVKIATAGKIRYPRRTRLLPEVEVEIPGGEMFACLDCFAPTDTDPAAGPHPGGNRRAVGHQREA